MSIRVSANLFRIAYLAVSKEETRYYLNGVFIEPHHERGATLTATDGHVLVSIYDAEAVCDTPVIVKLSKEALAACKPDKSLVTQRYVTIDVAAKSACVESGTFNGTRYERVNPIAFSPDALIDGSFPAWRTVVKTSTTRDPEQDAKGPYGAPAHVGYDPAYLGVFNAIARELSKKDATLCLTEINRGGAALITFPAAEHAFGLLMPKRADRAPELPSWFRVATATQIRDAA